MTEESSIEKKVGYPQKRHFLMPPAAAAGVAGRGENGRRSSVEHASIQLCYILTTLGIIMQAPKQSPRDIFM